MLFWQACYLPALNSARGKAKAIQCASNLKQMGLSLMMYSNDYNGWLLGAKPYNSDYAGWNRFLKNEGYINNKNLFYCPSEPAAQFDETSEAYMNMSYGMNYVTFGMKYTDDIKPIKAATLAKYKTGSNLIYIADSTVRRPSGQPGNDRQIGVGFLIKQGVVFPIDGNDVFSPVHIRHSQKANSLMFDGHVAGLNASDLKNIREHWSPYWRSGIFAIH